jgi:hypothetical protein
MGGSDGLYSEPFVIQHFADVLCTNPETMVFTSVVDIASRHSGLHCLEVDYTGSCLTTTPPPPSASPVAGCRARKPLVA